MQCTTGCSDCCHVRLTITRIEAAAIRVHVAGWPRARRQDLAITGPTDRCAALDQAGRCKIYDVRPLVCRSHGVPIRMRQGGLPIVQACHRNFTRTVPDPDCILDQTTLSAMLLAVEAAEARGTPPGLPRAKDAQGLSSAPDPASSVPAPSVLERPTGPAGLSHEPTSAEPVGSGVTHPGHGPGHRPGHRIDLAGLLADLAAI